MSPSLVYLEIDPEIERRPMQIREDHEVAIPVLPGPISARARLHRVDALASPFENLHVQRALGHEFPLPHQFIVLSEGDSCPLIDRPLIGPVHRVVISHQLS